MKRPRREIQACCRAGRPRKSRAGVQKAGVKGVKAPIGSPAVAGALRGAGIIHPPPGPYIRRRRRHLTPVPVKRAGDRAVDRSFSAVQRLYNDGGSPLEAEGLFRRPGSGGIGAGGQGCVVREDHRQIGLPPCGKKLTEEAGSLLGRMGRDKPLPGRSRWKAAPAEGCHSSGIVQADGAGIGGLQPESRGICRGRPDPEGGLRSDFGFPERPWFQKAGFKRIQPLQ